MQNQQIIAAVLSMHTKLQERLIDPQKIRSLLSKKLSSPQVSNPQQILNHLDEHINSKVEKVEAAIIKHQERQNKIKTVENRQLQSRSLLSQKLKLKLQKSSKKKLTQDKQMLQSKIAARKLKQQFFTERKKSITETQFKKRLEKFKSLKNQNQSQTSNQISHLPKTQRSTILKRSFSVGNTNQDPIQKRQQIQQIQYFKKLQALQKRKIYQKPQKIISIPQRVDKTEWIQKINSVTEEKYIQKLGLDLWKIQQARKKKQKSIIQKINQLKKRSEFKEQQRGYKIQTIKQQINAKIKTHRDVLNKKNQRFLTMRNKSTHHLQRNFSNISENRDTFEMSTKKGFFDSTNRMSRTLENFKQLANQSTLKAHQYYEKQQESKLKKELMIELEEILRRQKIEKLTK